MIKEDFIHYGNSDIFGSFQVCGDATISGAGFSSGSRACSFGSVDPDDSTAVSKIGGKFTPFNDDTKLYMGDVKAGAFASTDFVLGTLGFPNGSTYGSIPGTTRKLTDSSVRENCLADFESIECMAKSSFNRALVLESLEKCNKPYAQRYQVGRSIIFDTEGPALGCESEDYFIDAENCVPKDENVDMRYDVPTDKKVRKDEETGLTYWCVPKGMIEKAHSIIQVPRTAEDGWEEHFNVIVIIDEDNAKNNGSPRKAYAQTSAGQLPPYFSNGRSDLSHGRANTCRVYPDGDEVSDEPCPLATEFTARFPVSSDDFMKNTDLIPGTGNYRGECINPQKAAVSTRTTWVIDPAIESIFKNTLSWSGSMIAPFADLTSDYGNIEGNSMAIREEKEAYTSSNPNPNPRRRHKHPLSERALFKQ